jgi:hypothetical protein
MEYAKTSVNGSPLRWPIDWIHDGSMKGARMQMLYNLLIRADSVLRRLMAEGALMTYPEFAYAIGLLSPQETWTPARQREVADILKFLAALERRLTAGELLDFGRILSPTQVRLLKGGGDAA